MFRTVSTVMLVLCSVSPGKSASALPDDLQKGLLLQSEGRFLEAEQALRHSVSIAKASGSVDAQVRALLNLASVEADLSRFDEAIRIYAATLILLGRDPSANRDRIRTVQIQSAALYLEAGQLTVAEKLLRRISSEQRADDKATPSAAYALDVLASVYAEKKKFAEALTTERQSLTALANLVDSDPARIAIGTLHLAIFLNRSNMLPEALAYALRALEIVSYLPLPNPSMEASAEITVASIYSRMGHPDEARRQCGIALNTAEKHYGPNDRQVGLMLLAQAAVLRTVGDRQRARAAQKRAERILGDVAPPQLAGTVPIRALFSK
jgi:tetratricopeptide (TPR) repeat protein